MDIVIEVDDRRAQGKMDRLPGQTRARVEAALARGAEEIARLARRGAPKAFSNLANSIRATRIGELHYRVAPGVRHGAFVEQGRAPGVPAGTANGLMEWVRFRFRLEGTALERATWAVARAIGRKGIKPQPFMAPAAREGTPRVRALVEQALAQSAAELNRG